MGLKVMITIGNNQVSDMKRIMKFAGIIAASAALIVCCSKEASYDTPETNPTTQQQADDQGETGLSYVPGEVLASFSADFENDAATKVAFDEIGASTATLSFRDGDKVLVRSDSETKVYVYDTDKFTPESDGIAITDGIEVYYPANEFARSGDNIVFTMPAAVTDLSDLGTKNPLAGKIVNDGGYKVTMKAVGSILKVDVTGDRTLNSLMLSNIGPDLGDGATFTIGWDGEDKPTMATVGNSKQSMTISGLSVTLSETAKEYYFILPAGIAYDDLRVQATLATPDAGGINTFAVERGDWTPARNQFYKMSFYAGLFSGGTGTSEDPYIIASARDFKHINTYITNGYGSLAAADFLGAYYKQTADIDFKGVKMAPIGDSDNQFTGQYDGNSKNLLNVNIDETGQFAGIFAYVNGSGSIKDLTVSGNITKTGTTDNSCAGGIAGIVRGAATVTGCTNNTTINSSATYTGGIAGRLYQSTSSTAISGCTNNGSVTSSVSYTGGIVGQQIHGGTIVECVNKGTVSGTSYVGGIVGDIGAASTAPSAISFISFCRNDATINASANCSGGIAGRIINGSVVSSCFAKGTVSSESYDVGGIAGLVQVNNSNANSRVCVYDCLTAMNVTTTRSGASNEARTGGAVGFVSNNQAQYIAIDNCGVIATSVTVGGGTKVGGFVGRFASSNSNKNRTRIRNCYTLVSSISSPNSLYGGFVGNAESYGELRYCYYVADDTNVTIHNNTTQDNLTKKTAAEIASDATCETFNAHNYVLTIGSNDYGSSLGWNKPAGCDYPVPGSLSNKGEEYYK